MKRLFRQGLMLAALTIGLVFSLAAQSTQMTIHLNDGSESIYYMSENDRVYFEDNETLVVETIFRDKGILADRYPLADIRKITCAETEKVSDYSDLAVSLSPNPVHNAFMLRNLMGKEVVHIYSMDGRLMKSTEVAEGLIIDISDLPVGVYLVKTEHQTLKMIKL